MLTVKNKLIFFFCLGEVMLNTLAALVAVFVPTIWEIDRKFDWRGFTWGYPLWAPPSSCDFGRHVVFAGKHQSGSVFLSEIKWVPINVRNCPSTGHKSQKDFRNPTQPKEATQRERTVARDPRNTEKKRELHSLAKVEDKKNQPR